MLAARKRVADMDRVTPETAAAGCLGRRRDAHGPGGRVASPALGRSLGLSAGSQFAWQCVAAIALTGGHSAGEGDRTVGGFRRLGERPRKGLRGAETQRCDGAAAHAAPRLRPPAPAWAGEAGAVCQRIIIPASQGDPPPSACRCRSTRSAVSFMWRGRSVHVSTHAGGRAPQACCEDHIMGVFSSFCDGVSATARTAPWAQARFAWGDSHDH